MISYQEDIHKASNEGRDHKDEQNGNQMSNHEVSKKSGKRLPVESEHYMMSKILIRRVMRLAKRCAKGYIIEGPEHMYG